MALFQNIIKKKHVAAQSDKIKAAYGLFTSYFHNPAIQENILASKEEQFQEGFLRELFVKILGYTLNPDANYNLITERKNEKDAKKADGAIIIKGEVVGVIELKDHKAIDLKQIETQAFGYKNNNRKASYVVTSNFEKLRFYIDNAVEFEEFNLFSLTEGEFAVLWLCLAYENIARDLPKHVKAESINNENDITKKLYKDYSEFKRALFADLVARNEGYDRLTLFKKSQKLLDRLLFILFAEDCGLLPANSIVQIIEQWEKLKELDEYRPLYERFKKYFGYLNTGHKGALHDIFAYNGGLFKPDELLDVVEISDEVLYTYSKKVSAYNFASEVDVNILGHIFENSLTEIEEITNSITSGETTTQTSKRKKDGVFYTPRYITTYIVKNTLGKLFADKKAELEIVEAEYFADKKRQLATKKRLDVKLKTYREWLLQLTICDPACGSGAFLNAALDYLMSEHRLVDELTAKLLGHSIAFPDIEKAILENNLFGVDINEESVEIAKLSLWLRTAKPHRKLNSLNDNIKCGNSLISDPEVAGEKAFDWYTEFPQVFAKDGFDVVIGNPPYGATLSETDKKYIEQAYSTFEYQVNSYVIFYEKGINILKSNGILGFITPSTFTYQFYFKHLRDYFTNFSLLNVCKYTYEVFEDANIGDSISWVIQKTPNQKLELEVLICKSSDDIQKEHTIVSYDYLINHDGTYNLSDCSINQSKLWEGSKGLTEVTSVIVGVKAYQKGKGIPKQTEETVKSKIFTSYHKVDDTYIQCIIGKDFHRYKYISEPEMYISYGKWLAEPRDGAPFFDDEKLILRQTADSLIANIDSQKRVNLNNVYNIGSNGSGIALRYILTLINSRLLNFIYQIVSQEKGRIFAEVKKVNLAKLPIKHLSSEAQQPFIEQADKMLRLNADLQGSRSKFLRRLQDNFEGVKITGTIEKFDTLDFATFVHKLAKQKITLSLNQQDEWEEYFNTCRTDCLRLTTEITATDNHIDQMVYTLYGLTADEIAIVEK